MKKSVSLLLIIAAATLNSCSKEAEGTGSAEALYGEWKLTGVKNKMGLDVSTAGSSINQRILFNSQYASTSASGLLRFSEAKAETVNIEYAFKGTTNVKVYSDGTLTPGSGVDREVEDVMPKSSGSSSYTAIGTDSIFFPSGGAVTIKQPGNPAGTTMPTLPSGYKYKVEGNRMTMYLNYATSQTQTAQGMTVASATSANIEMTFQKQ